MGSTKVALTADSIADSNRFVDFKLNAARGKMNNVFIKKLVGYNASVALAADEDIIGIGGTLEEFGGTAATVDVVSGHADDDVGGAGMEKVTVYGLNSSYGLASEEISLNGVGTVTSTATFQFVYKIQGTQYGANGTNTGIITLNITGGNDVISIAAVENRSFSAAFMIPANYEGFLYRYKTRFDYVDGTAIGTVNIVEKLFGEAAYSLLEPIAILETEEKSDSFDLPETLAEKTIIKMIAGTETNVSPFHGKLELLLMPKVS